MYGGWNGSDLLVDTWRFWLETETWKEIDTQGSQPTSAYDIIAGAAGGSVFLLGQTGPYNGCWSPGGCPDTTPWELQVSESALWRRVTPLALWGSVDVEVFEDYYQDRGAAAITPFGLAIHGGQEISYKQKKLGDIELDVDMCKCADRPVENVVFYDEPPEGS
eukprot:Skav219231  [mRNA]  locus=scaffold2965:215402:222504:- [translate_table: standard]